MLERGKGNVCSEEGQRRRVCGADVSVKVRPNGWTFHTLSRGLAQHRSHVLQSSSRKELPPCSPMILAM